MGIRVIEGTLNPLRGWHYFRWLFQFAILGGLIGAAWLGPSRLGMRGPWAMYKEILWGALTFGVPIAMITGVIFQVLARRFDAGEIGRVRWWCVCLFSCSWPVFILIAVEVIRSGLNVNGEMLGVFVIWGLLWVCTLMTASILSWLHKNQIHKAALAISPLIAWHFIHLARFYGYMRP